MEDVLRLDAEAYVQTTRSKHVFSAWDGSRAAPSSSLFDFDRLLEVAVAEGNAEADDPCLQEHDYGPPPLLPSTASQPPSTAKATPSILERPSALEGLANSTAPVEAQAAAHPSAKRPPSHAPSHSKALHRPEMDIKEARRLRNKERTRLAKKRKREGRREEDLGYYEPRPTFQTRHVDFSSKAERQSGLDGSKAASTGFVGLNTTDQSQRIYGLEELVGEDSKYKFDLLEWDGEKTIPIVHANRVIALLGGHPHDDAWDAVNKECAHALESRRSRCVPPKGRLHRRGNYVALSCGVSHGGGQQEPGNLQHAAPNKEVLKELNELRCFKRLAGFTNSLMANWSPDLYNYYVTRLRKLHESKPSLERIFSSSVFSAATYNFGPTTQCFKHTDLANLPFGWCTVTALGSFDPKAGGHLVMWDCRLVIEFPPGSTILFLSAVITHSNTPVPSGSRRYSFAQYSAGGLFRWVENDFKTQTRHYQSLNQDELWETRWKNARRWEYGISLYRRVSEGGPS